MDVDRFSMDFHPFSPVVRGFFVDFDGFRMDFRDVKGCRGLFPLEREGPEKPHGR